MAITLSHGGPSIYSSSSPSSQVLVGTIEGVVSIERDSGDWRVTHRTLTDKHVHALVIEPESGTIFAGANHGSVYASVDGGNTWEPRDNGLTEQDIYSLQCAQVNGRARIYAGTEPAHLYCSDDLGQQWTELEALRSVDMSNWGFPAPPHIAHTKHINFHPNDPETLFVGIEQGGLLKSTDSGRTFNVVAGMDDDVHRTVINPLNPERIYITTGIGMFVTSDGGASWERYTDLEHEIGGYPDLLVLHPRHPDLLFVASAKRNPGTWSQDHWAGSRISRSTDGGRTWEILRNGLPDRLTTAFEAMCLEEWGDSFSIFGATATGEVWYTEDGGDHWTEVVSGLAPISKGSHYKAFVTA